MSPPYWPRLNRFLEGLRGPRPPVTMWMTLESVVVVEMAASYGIDAMFIDLEHTAASLEDVRAMIIAAQGAGVTALVRPSSIDPHDVGRILDAGAEGIVFAQVSTPEEAETAYRSLRYPPEGTRGWAGMHARHVRWNQTPPGPGEFPLASAEFASAVNAQVASIFMIESQAGLDALDEILDIGRPDGVVFGWADFSVSIGFDKAGIEAARKRIYDACRSRGIGMAITVSPRDPMEYYPGCFLGAGTDASLASEALRLRLLEAAAVSAELVGPADSAPGATERSS